MQISTVWFLLLLALTGLGLYLGCWLGRSGTFRARAGLALAVVVLLVWSWLFHHQSVAVRIFPPEVLQYLEGIGGVPAFMIIAGIVLVRGATRQRRLAIFALVFGLLFFVNGGWWMIQDTPQTGFADVRRRGDLIMQSQEFSCVPAACATALNSLGYHATEAQLAQLTDTRPGTGATMIRAMSGLGEFLRSKNHSVELIDLPFAGLDALSTPALTPVRSDGARYLHMVTILDVRPDDVLIADPQAGPLLMQRCDFAKVYTGSVLVFHEQ